MKNIEFWCSGCGNHTRHNRSVAGVKKFITEGWRALGDVIYCPDCAKRISDREGYRRLYDAEETAEWIYNKIL